MGDKAIGGAAELQHLDTASLATLPDRIAPHRAAQLLAAMPPSRAARRLEALPEAVRAPITAAASAIIRFTPTDVTRMALFLGLASALLAFHG